MFLVKKLDDLRAREREEKGTTNPCTYSHLSNKRDVTLTDFTNRSAKIPQLT